MDIIEAYYAVARDLEQRARAMAHTAEIIAELADRMSEARMRETPPSAEGKGDAP